MVSSRDAGPEGEAADLHGGEEGGGVLGVAGRDATPPLKMKESVLDQMPQTVQAPVVLSLHLAVLSWRNDGRHALTAGLLHDLVAVVASVGDQVFGRDAVDQAANLRAICCGTLRNKNSDRHTVRIHGQV